MPLSVYFLVYKMGVTQLVDGLVVITEIKDVEVIGKHQDHLQA